MFPLPIHDLHDNTTKHTQSAYILFIKSINSGPTVRNYFFRNDSSRKLLKLTKPVGTSVNAQLKLMSLPSSQYIYTENCPHT